MPTAYHAQSRALPPASRAGSTLPSRASRPAFSEWYIAGMPAGGNSRLTVAALRYVSTRLTRRGTGEPARRLGSFNGRSGRPTVDEWHDGRVPPLEQRNERRRSAV